MVAGLQYNNNTWGKCFFSTYDTVMFLDNFVQDYYNMINYGNFYSLLIYDPIRFLSNYFAVYELCNAGRIFDLFNSIMNLDFGVILETLTR